MICRRSRAFILNLLSFCLFLLLLKPLTAQEEKQADLLAELQKLNKNLESLEHRLDEIEKIVLTTHESAIRIISKVGPLANPADRDHCLQYVVAVALINGSLTADHYLEAAAVDPRIDALRDRMSVEENPRYSREYLDPRKRAIGNAVQVHFRDGTATERVEVKYPIGHRRRRAEAIPLLMEKARRNLQSRLPAAQVEEIVGLCLDADRLETMPADAFLGMLCGNPEGRVTAL